MTQSMLLVMVIKMDASIMSVDGLNQSSTVKEEVTRKRNAQRTVKGKVKIMNPIIWAVIQIQKRRMGKLIQNRSVVRLSRSREDNLIRVTRFSSQETSTKSSTAAKKKVSFS